MTLKKEFKKAVKEMENNTSGKPNSTKKPPSLKERVNRIVEGNDPRYHLR
tara:strand:- start:108 stop:257 length:150 start_codon:yes stop_codon:yes gene_type:complete